MPSAVVWINGEKRVIEADSGSLVSDALMKNGISILKPCGGRGSCGKCAIEMTGRASELSYAEKRLGTRLACQSRVMGDVEIFIKDPGDMRQIETDTPDLPATLDPVAGKIGAAVDIGTTTLALKLYDLASGVCLATSSAINPQTVVAADVMGRIGAAMAGGLSDMRRMIIGAVASLACEARAGFAPQIGAVDAFVVTGNTTMLYLLTGRDPKSLSRAPFEADCLFDETTRLLDGECYLPPCMNAFVGADITCAILACGMCDRDETALLCDIGTNGEIALWHKGKLYVTSTAAGPAFEGAGISCGVGSVKGAIDKVGVANNSIWVSTIGGGKAVGVCGSGLIDAVAAFLRLGEIDETGATENDVLPLADGVSLIPKDIRCVQLAKAAIAAGIATMLQQAGIETDAVQKVYIAGGFGSHINIASAADIGLIPRELSPRVRVVGNAALAGAARMLLNKREAARAREIAGLSRHVNLGGNPRFNENYMEMMTFPEVF